MIEAALQLARERAGESRDALFELLRVPSVSALSEHADDCRRAAGLLVDRLRSAGMEADAVEVEGGRHPVVVAEWLGAGPDRPTLALYGHYDVQPPDPLEQWETPPFEPSVRDGFVHARGADDNKGQLMCSVRAAELAFAAGPPPVNLRFLVEGEEEIGGESLPRLLRERAAGLRSDYVLVADGQFTAPGMPNLLTALRGLVYVEVEARGAAADLHSGIFGGIAPNPLNTLAHVIASLKDREGRVRIPGFYDAVREPSPAELAGWRSLPDPVSEMGARAPEGEPGFTPTERRWARPTLDVHGIAGGFTGEGQKTVIPARAVAKVSMRLVPDQDPAAVFANFERHVAAQETPGIALSSRLLSAGPPVLLGTDHPGLEAASRAFQAAFGARPVLTREGGSIPVTIDFQRALGAHLLVTGFGLPGDRLHSPNERHSLDQYQRGIEMVLHLMEELAHAR